MPVAPTLLQIDNLLTQFHTDDGVVKAVDGISLRIDVGKTLGLVGESGSGQVGHVADGHAAPARRRPAGSRAGTIAWLGAIWSSSPQREMRNIRGDEISMIFQEPGTSLNPVFTVGEQVMEAIRLHQTGLAAPRPAQRTLDLFHEVGIPDPEARMRQLSRTRCRAGRSSG